MGIKLGLGRMRRLLSQMGDPQDSFASVHVAGSKGKGSTCAMLESILRHSGSRTGLYTSPHLMDFRERIRVDGVEITEREVVALAQSARRAAEEAGVLEQMTFFEITTAMALQHFRGRGVQVAVIEVGMGGALDATNVIHPMVTVITRIEREHTHYLGGSEAGIAFEKAGIIKEGIPVITGESEGDALTVIRAACRDHGCALRVSGVDFHHSVSRSDLDGVHVRLDSIGREVIIPLHGTYQGGNAALACEAAMVLRRRGPSLKEEGIALGLSRVVWPGRLQVVAQEPLLILDVSHTAEGAAATAEDLRRLRRGRTVLVLGILEDKDADGIAAALMPVTDAVICVAPETKRALPAARLAEACRRGGGSTSTAASVARGIEAAFAQAGKKGTVIIAGSFYTVGEGMAWLAAKQK
jgi:dihydrofolate synthase/folylpolyglutamate synthase